jgi:PQQ-like domain
MPSRRIFAAAALSVALVARGGAQQQHPLWRFAADTDVYYFTQTSLGNVLVVSGRNITSIDPETGKPTWTITDSAGFAPKWEVPIPMTPSLWVLGDDGVGVVDLQTGAWKWHNPSPTLGTSRGPFFLPEKQLALEYIVRPNESPVLAAVDIETGRVKWHSTDAIQRQVHTAELECCGGRKLPTIEANLSPIVDRDSVIVLWLSEDGPVALNANSGAVIWRATSLAGKTPPTRTGGYAPMLVANGVLYVPYENRLAAIDLATGASIWSNPREYKAHVAQMELLPKGLVVRTEIGPHDGGFVKRHVLELLDPKTGAPVWPDSYGDLAQATPFVARNDSVFVAMVAQGFTTHERLMGVALGNGASREVANYDFKGDERPLLLESRPTGFVLLSSQNVLMIDSAGLVRYHTYLPAPQASKLARFGLGALNLAANIAMYSIANSGSPSTRPGLFFPGVNINVDTRYRRTVEMQRYTYIVTPVPDSTGELVPGVVRVNKDTGKDEGRIPLGGKNRYVIDEAEGRVYILASPRELIAYRF